MNEERITVGEVWGIRLNDEPGAPWFDLYLILGVDERTNNCHAFSLIGDRLIRDFSIGDGFPLVLGLEAWERVL